MLWRGRPLETATDFVLALMARAHLAEHADGAGDAEEDGVEVLLFQLVVLQQHPRVRVHIGPRVLHLRRWGDRQRIRIRTPRPDLEGWKVQRQQRRLNPESKCVRSNAPSSVTFLQTNNTRGGMPVHCRNTHRTACSEAGYLNS